MNNLTPHFFNSLAIIIGFSIVLAILAVFFKRRYNRHTYNQKLSKKILKKINSSTLKKGVKVCVSDVYM